MICSKLIRRNIITLRTLGTMSSRWKNREPYSSSNHNFSKPLPQSAEAVSSGSTAEENLKTYSAACHCGRVKYEVQGSPLDAKLCHCRDCQKLHGAPFEWVCIFHKHNVRFTQGHDHLYFYNSELDQGWHASPTGNEGCDGGDTKGADERILPVKVSCAQCRTPIADEGRNMWLAFATLFDFGYGAQVPAPFRHTCHLFYGERCIDLNDDKPKWEGHKNRSALF